LAGGDTLTPGSAVFWDREPHRKPHDTGRPSFQTLNQKKRKSRGGGEALPWVGLTFHNNEPGHNGTLRVKLGGLEQGRVNVQTSTDFNGKIWKALLAVTIPTILPSPESQTRTRLDKLAGTFLKNQPVKGHHLKAKPGTGNGGEPGDSVA